MTPKRTVAQPNAAYFSTTAAFRKKERTQADILYANCYFLNEGMP